MHLKTKIYKARLLYCSNRHYVLTGIDYHWCFGKIDNGATEIYIKTKIQNKNVLLKLWLSKKAPSFIQIPVFSWRFCGFKCCYCVKLTTIFTTCFSSQHYEWHHVFFSALLWSLHKHSVEFGSWTVLFRLPRKMRQ